MTIVRCPKCGSTDAASDEARSRVELTYMHCNGCGYGELVDSEQIKSEWNASIPEGALPSHVKPT
jgi:predicted nucleic-acid-binding Zn-ribbon protein